MLPDHFQSLLLRMKRSLTLMSSLVLLLPKPPWTLLCSRTLMSPWTLLWSTTPSLCLAGREAAGGADAAEGDAAAGRDVVARPQKGEVPGLLTTMSSLMSRPGPRGDPVSYTL